VNVASLLASMPVPVPRILAHSNELGIIALQDLGDVTLQAHLGAATPGEHAALYREAVGLIATLQRRGAELAGPGYVPYGIAFDVEKLTWELNFFLKHFLEAYRGASFTDDARAALSDEFATIVGELAAEPRVLCHRDYHSRNLMLHEGQLYIIDFQDARLGPDTYDLVSLLRDSYVDLTDAQVDELIAYFLALRGHWFSAWMSERLDRLDEFGVNVRNNTRAGVAGKGLDLGKAESARGRIWHTFRELFERYDHLLTPTMAVPPFPVEQNYPETVAGKAMTTYIDWLAPTFVLSLTGLPVASVPCGLDPGGMPVGLQLVGRPEGEEAVLALAAQLERLNPIGPPRI